MGFPNKLYLTDVIMSKNHN